MRLGPETSERFVVQEVIAAGGMGAVHRALDRRTGAIVALKLLLPEADSPELAERFALEAEALAALEHPAIVRLVAHGTTPEGRPFLAMEWLDGEDLSARLDRGNLAPSEVVALALRVADALSAAHARGVVHRDIKPSNLFLPGGLLHEVKVLDFGIARVRGRRAITASNEMLGTPGYMAPEQASGSKDIDGRADIFSLGAVLFECLTGRPPFSGEHPLAVLAKIVLDDAPRVHEVSPGVPEALASLVDKMLSRDRAARPQRAEVIREALLTVLAALPSEDEPERVHASARDPLPPEALTGREQRLMTVLMIRPGQQRAALRSPEPSGEVAAVETERPWSVALRRLREAVEPLGGRINHVLGGSVLVTWTGAEGPSEQASRAARCALLVRQLDPEAVIAVISGLGDALEPRPVGQVLDRAAALLAVERGVGRASIRLDTVAARLLDARFQIVQSATTLELLGEEDIGQGARTLLGSPTPCVGRERELRAITDLLDECVRESVARAVLITAPAGVGKSRLRHELLSRLSPRFDGVEVWLARADCMSAGSAFATIGSALRSATNVRNGEPLSASLQKLFTRVAQRVPPADQARVAAFLGELLGVHFPDNHSPLLGPARQSTALMAEQIRRAWVDFVAAECSARPVLFVIEDLHWGDTPSVSLLDATLGSLCDRPFFLLALGRPELHDMFPKLWAKRSAQEIRLDGLSRRASEELARHVLGATADDGRIAQIIARASGNAFYLEELIRSTAEGEGDALPETVLAMVQARLDTLAPDERRVLRAASVFGEAFWLGGVAALLGDGERVTEVESHLSALLSREFLVTRKRSRFPAEQELNFRHGLVRDGAYAGLTESDRALAHSLAGAWLERAGEDDAVVLAEHFDRGNEPARAMAYHLAEALRALMGNDLHTTIERAGRSLPEGADDTIRLKRAYILNEAYWFMGDRARADGYADEILRIAAPGSSMWCSAMGVKMMSELELGSQERMSVVIAMFMGTELTVESTGLLARVYCILVFVFSITGLRDLTAYFLDLAARGAASTPNDPVTQWFLSTARAQWHLFFEGNFFASCVEHHRALVFSEQAGQNRFNTLSHGLLGWSYTALGALDRAEHHLRRAIDMSPPKGLGGLIGRSFLSWVLAERGELDEALAEGKRALDLSRGAAFMEGVARTVISNAQLQRGELGDAEWEAREGAGVLASMPILRAGALTQMALAQMAQGRSREALNTIGEALGPDEPCRVNPFMELRARLLDVDARAALGDIKGSRAALVRAHARILDMSSKIEDEALRRGFLEGVSSNARILTLAAERL